MNYIYRRDFHEEGTREWWRFDGLADKVRDKAYSEGVGQEFESEVLNG
jgi:hypothetical protein